MFNKRSDYLVPLLRLLDNLPDRTAKTSDAVNLFEQKYHQYIPAEHYEDNSSGYSKYQYHIEWVRNTAREKGLIDSPAHGIWRLSDKGHTWLAEHPGATHYTAEIRVPIRIKKTKPHHIIEKAPIPPQVNINDKNGHRTSEKIDTSPLYKILDHEVAVIQAYIQGSHSWERSSEQLCDWINFCYKLELYTEGKDLFYFVSKSEVNPWYYERTRKIAKVCEQRAKLAGQG
jgi:hypothetical protein